MHNRKVKRWFNCSWMLALSGFLFWQSFSHFLTFFEIRDNIRKNEKEVSELTRQEEDLEETRQNLDNPDYLEFYVNGKYLVTQSGDQVFKFPQLDLGE